VISNKKKKFEQTTKITTISQLSTVIETPGIDSTIDICPIIIKIGEIKEDSTYYSYDISNLKYHNFFRNYNEKNEKDGSIYFGILNNDFLKKINKSKQINRTQSVVKESIPYVEETDFTPRDFSKFNYQYNFGKKKKENKSQNNPKNDEIDEILQDEDILLIDILN
jgi:hypothetical protein